MLHYQRVIGGIYLLKMVVFQSANCWFFPVSCQIRVSAPLVSPNPISAAAAGGTLGTPWCMAHGMNCLDFEGDRGCLMGCLMGWIICTYSTNDLHIMLYHIAFWSVRIISYIIYHILFCVLSNISYHNHILLCKFTLALISCHILV